MIERVLIGGVDVALTDVFAAVTIRHGRASADDAPMASTCSLTLVNVERSLAISFEVADSLEVLLQGDVPRFVGTITDADLSAEGLSIVAVSSLARITTRTIGAADWPEESWSDRVARAFREGNRETWASSGALAWDDDPGLTWDAPATEPVTVSIEVGDTDPVVAARAAQPVTLGAYLANLAETEPAAIASLPDGRVIVQALTARKALPAIALDPFEVADAPEWAMIDDVENLVTVVFDGGSVVADGSAGRDARPVKIETELANEADAQILANLRLARRSTPEWLVDSADLLALDPSIGIGSPIVIPDLPSWAPSPSYLGIVEGWEDHVDVEGDEISWTQRLTLSAPRLSGYGLAWEDVDPSISWADAGTTTWYSPTL